MNLCISIGIFLGLSRVATAEVLDVIHCKSNFFVQGYRRIDSEKGQTVLMEIRELLNKVDGFKVIAQFDHANAALDGRAIPLDGMIIAYSAHDEKAEAILDKIESFNGVSVGCVTRKAFDINMNFLGL
ncbi:MAG: hypothetical protein P4M08_12775 [Oligoflexia bacterium]|nr:hypothetical protein [Oligoflexia bacterium]